MSKFKKFPVGRPFKLVTVENKQPITTSLVIARYFEKRHDAVLRDIRMLECSDEFRAHNFVEAEYLDLKKHHRPMFKMTRDGFIFLITGFIGRRAGAIKEAYINAFNEMEQRLKEKQERKALPPAQKIVREKPLPPPADPAAPVNFLEKKIDWLSKRLANLEWEVFHHRVVPFEQLQDPDYEWVKVRVNR